MSLANLLMFAAHGVFVDAIMFIVAHVDVVLLVEFFRFQKTRRGIAVLGGLEAVAILGGIALYYLLLNLHCLNFNSNYYSNTN